MSQDKKPRLDSQLIHKLAQASKLVGGEQIPSQKKSRVVESEPTLSKRHSRHAMRRIYLDDVLKLLVLARATELARAGRYAEAESLLKASIPDLETMPAALDLLARIYAQQRRFQDAYTFWTRALQLDATNVAYQAGLARLKEHWLAEGAGSHWAQGGGHSDLIYRLVLQLGPYIETHKLGAITLSHTGYEIVLPGQHYTVWEPDLAFVRADKLPIKDTPAWNRPWKVMPDLVIEIVPPNIERRAADQRASTWIEQGVRLIWLFWPAEQSVDVWIPRYRRPILTLKASGTLDGQSVIPGFTCPLQSIFGAPPPN
jgi:Uma2 family endonuclease